MQHPIPEKSIASKPSLLSSSDRADADEVRILNTLSGGKPGSKAAAAPVAKKNRRSGAMLIVLAALVLAGIAWAVKDNAPAAPLRASAPAPASPAAETPPGPRKSGEPTAVSDAGPGATLIDDRATDATAAQDRADAPSASSQGNLNSALEEGVKPPPAALQKALEAAPASAKKEKPAKQASVVHQARKPAEAARKGTRHAAGGQADNDVDLISALVAHSAQADRKPASGKKDTAATQKLAAKDDGKAHERNEDIIERRGNESTASLLQRCHALGFIEGELCRWRICSGRWDDDVACKVKN